MSCLLPSFDARGHLPEGIHDASLDEVHKRFVTNSKRAELWERLQEFLKWVVLTNKFSYVYIDGGFTTAKEVPTDIDIILQTQSDYGPEAFRAMMPFFEMGIVKIYQTYSIHLHFWCEGFPNGMSDFRLFFQYFSPEEEITMPLSERAKKGIVRITLT